MSKGVFGFEDRFERVNLNKF